MRLSDERLNALESDYRPYERSIVVEISPGVLLDLIAEVRALRPCEKAAEDFVAKVDSGRARSVDSYGKFAAALAGVRALEDR